ncbi:MAG: ABC transporter permease [Acidimicrobiales bacterium]
MSDATIAPDGSAVAPDRAHVAAPKKDWGRFFRWMVEANVFVVTSLAIFSGLFVGAILIIVTQSNTIHAWSLLFSHPGTTVSVTWFTVADAYKDIFTGSIVDPLVLGHAIHTGHGWVAAMTPISETLRETTVLSLAGLAVALGFRTGLFNIGVQGQLIAGAMSASYVGFTLNANPWLEIPLCILAGMAGGALAGFIPGILKARTGAHEVIVTIMLNYVFLNLLVYAITTQPFQQPGQSNAIGRSVHSVAQLPHLFGQTLRVNVGLFIAIAALIVVAWILRRSSIGFSFRMAGTNPDAARVAGVNIARTTVIVFLICGALAGLAGMVQLNGTDYFLSSGYGGLYGPDAITIALLGRNRPLGVFFGAMLFSALDVGGRFMQATTSIPLDLTQVIQAVIIFFVATPGLVNEVYRIRGRNVGQSLLTQGWGA